MSILILAISCLITSNLPWFMDLIFQAPMQYCSYSTRFSSPLTSTTGCSFCFVSISSFFLELFLHSSPVAYQASTDLGSLSFSIISFCLFVLFQIWLWRTVGLDYRTYTGLGKQTLEGHKRNLVCTRTQEKRKVIPQPWCIPLPIWNQSVIPCPVLTFASWPAYRFLRRQVRWSGISISWRILHSLLWSTQ